MTSTTPEISCPGSATGLGHILFLKGGGQMRCKYCGWSCGKHDANCHKDVTEEVAKEVLRWAQGQSDGRKGNQPVSTGDTHYMMGWNYGNVALEEAENGSQSWSD